MPHGEMQVRILGKARETDPADRTPRLDLVARLDQHTAGGHVAILGFPLPRMADDDAVSTFGVTHRLASRFYVSTVRSVVASAKNAAPRGRAHIDTGPLRRQRRQAEIDAIVVVIGERTALVVSH